VGWLVQLIWVWLRIITGLEACSKVFKTTLDDVVKETIAPSNAPEMVASSILLAATWTSRAKSRMVTAKKDEAIKLKKAADALKATEDKGAEGVNAHK
jgi:hypothetical protein